MLGRPDIDAVWFGAESLEGAEKVDEFKLSMGFVKRPIRQRIVLHPLLRPLFRSALVMRGVAALAARQPRNELWRKLAAHLRILHRMTVAAIAHARPRTAAVNPVAVVYPDNLAALGVCRSLGVHGVPCVVLSSRSHGSGPVFTLRPPGGLPTRCGRAARSRSSWSSSSRGAAGATGPVPHRRCRPGRRPPSSGRVLEDWYRFPLAPWPVVSRLLFKDELYRELDGVVPVPRTAIPGDESDLAGAAREVGFPAVVKPFLRYRSGAGRPRRVPFEKFFGAKAVRVRTAERAGRPFTGARRRTAFACWSRRRSRGPSRHCVSVGLYATPHRRAGGLHLAEARAGPGRLR